MILESIQRIEGAAPLGYERLQATVRAKGGRLREAVWFDLPEDRIAGSDQTGNPWLLLLLPVAMRFGEPLEIPFPVDPILHENALELMRVWSTWRSDCRPVEIRAPRFEPAAPGPGTRAGQFFTSGVDSWFTLLQLDSQPDSPGPVDELLYGFGFDIPLEDHALVARKLASLRAVAAAVGKHLSVFRTNLRSTIHRSVPWGPLGHGFALGASALLMESHFSRIHIAASLDLRDLLPWGSHPATDPLMSTSLLRFHHHGIEHGRLEKLAFLARHGFALRSLQVCYHDRVQENCGHCEKCYRTLIALEILDARPLATSFPADAFRLDQIPRIHMPDEFVRGRFRELLEHARTRGRTDLCAVMEESLRWNEKVDRIARGAGAIGRIPGLARLGLSLQRRARRLMARHAIG